MKTLTVRTLCLVIALVGLLGGSAAADCAGDAANLSRLIQRGVRCGGRLRGTPRGVPCGRSPRRVPPVLNYRPAIDAGLQDQVIVRRLASVLVASSGPPLFCPCPIEWPRTLTTPAHWPPSLL